MTLINLVKETDSTILKLDDIFTSILMDLFERSLICFSQPMVACIEHIGVIDASRVDYFDFIHLPIMPDNLVCLLFVRKK